MSMAPRHEVEHYGKTTIRNQQGLYRPLGRTPFTEKAACTYDRQRQIGYIRLPTLIVHPRVDDRASLRNLNYLQGNLEGLTHTVFLGQLPRRDARQAAPARWTVLSSSFHTWAKGQQSHPTKMVALNGRASCISKPKRSRDVAVPRSAAQKGLYTAARCAHDLLTASVVTSLPISRETTVRLCRSRSCRW
jgi:hypothetical protein